MQRYFGIAQTLEGQAVPSATIRVRLAGTATDATIYSDNAYTPLANPFTSETDGVYQFYARDGRYDIIVTKTGYTFDNDDTADILLQDAASVITPAQITSDQNNYSPTNALNASVWRISSDVIREISGIAAGNTQQYVTLVNVGSFNILLLHQSSSSSAANRFTVPGLRSYVLFPGESVSIRYDTTSTTWQIEAIQGLRSLSRIGAGSSINVTGSTESSLWSTSVSGGLLSTGSLVQLKLNAAITTTGAFENPTLRLYYGGTALSVCTPDSALTQGNSVGYYDASLVANGSTAQMTRAFFMTRTGIGVASTGNGVIASTDTQIIEVTVQMESTTTSTGIFFQRQFASLDWLP